MKKQILIISFLVLILFSCQKETSDTVAKPSEVDVYVAGFVSGVAYSNEGDAIYWKNGSLVQIDDADKCHSSPIKCRIMACICEI